MITFFNRRELISTYSMKKQGEIRTILSQNDIDYHVKTVNRKSPSPVDAGSRVRVGTLGENLALSYEYIIYVKKEDYNKAKAFIGK